MKDFAPVSLGVGQSYLVVNPSVPANSMKELENRLLETKGVRDSLIGAGFEPRGGSPEEFGALIRRDHERWGKVVKISGVKVQ